MFWADSIGLSNIMRELEKMYAMHPDSEYFRPSKLLRECVRLDVGVKEYYNRGYAKVQGRTVSKL